MENEDVPMDIVSEILCLLPVKSLRRFLTVSKSLRSLIHDPCFILSHLEQAAKTNSDSVIVCLNGDRNIYLSAMNSPGELLSYDFPSLRDKPLPYRRIQVRGSCNGLTCLTVFDRFLIISNFSTKDYHITSIPFLNTSTNDVKSNPFYGFGFDSASDDYKVLMIVPYNTLFRFKDEDYYVKTAVYSLRCNAWSPTKHRGRFPRLKREISSDNVNGVFCSGALHWLAEESLHDYGPKFILAFDLISEGFHEMPLPPQEGKESDMRLYKNSRLGVLEGCLLMSSRVSCKKPIYDIWIMKDYNIHRCWTKLFRIISNTPWTALTPLFHSRSDHKVLLLSECRRCFYWYDLEREQLEHVLTSKISPPGGYPDVYIAAICLGTLVSINAYKVLWKEDGNSRRKGRRGKRRRSMVDNGIDMQTQVDPPQAEFDEAISCFLILLKRMDYQSALCLGKKFWCWTA